MLKMTLPERFQSFHAVATAGKPEIVFSDAFPAGHLPRPLLPPCPPERDKMPNLKKVQADKKHRKSKWVNAQTILNGTWTGDMQIVDENCPNGPAERPRLHNVIDRIDNSSLAENGLYSSDETWYTDKEKDKEKKWERLDLYIVVDSFIWHAEKLSEALKQMFSLRVWPGYYLRYGHA